MNIIKMTHETLTLKIAEEITAIADEGFSGKPFPRRYDPDYFLRAWKYYLSNGSFGLFIAFGEDGAVKGFIGGCVGPDTTSPDLLAIESIWRVKSHGGGLGRKLYDVFLEWCQSMGAKYYLTVAMHDENEQKMINFYESNGFTLHGRQYIKEI